MNKLSKITLIGLMLVGVVFAASCASREASKARSRYLIERGDIVPADEIRVEEYLNYYDQRFALPLDAALNMEVALGSDLAPQDGGDMWLQVGLQARRVRQEAIKPMNVAVVIDKSGSMADADKMTYLKQALHVFVDELDEEDILSLVVYDSEAWVLMSARPVTDRQYIKRLISGIWPGGSTNLHGGLMLGYQEVKKNFNSMYFNNRVILLTDGIANRGVTDPQEIAQDSRLYNEQGIYLSTIGLGREINDQLMSTLAQQGKGNYYFIDRPAEMERVFRQELQGLVEKAAKDIRLWIELSEGVRSLGVYGYPYRQDSEGVYVELDDMGSGQSQVVLLHLWVPPGQGSQYPLAYVHLEYKDLDTGRPVSLDDEVYFSYGSEEAYSVQNMAVLRNYTIIQMALALQEVDRLFNAGRYEEALSLVTETKGMVRHAAELFDDDQLREDVGLLEKYEDTLRRAVNTGSQQRRYEEEQEYGQREYRGVCMSPLVWFIPALGTILITGRLS